MSQTIVIIGAGHAASELACTLRQEGFAGRLVMVGEEPHLPYQRPPLSKAYLSGTVTQDSFTLRTQATYDKAGIELRLGVPAVAIDRARRTVALADGTLLPYDRLALATGGRARALTLPGGGGELALLLRTVDDVKRLQAAFSPGKRALIVGGGYIGLEVAAVAVREGLQVTLLESADRLLARVATPTLSGFYQRLHSEAGVHVHTGVQLHAIERLDDGSLLARSADGASWGADVVLAGIGLLPETTLAEQAGLQLDNGIAVDDYARTSDPDIVAVGDCASHYNHFAGRRLRLESVQNAAEQARTAAATLCGKVRPYQVVPWFWSDQYQLKLQMVGLSQGYDAAVLRGTLESKSFVQFYLRAGMVIAADAVNRPADFMQAKRLVAGGGGALSAAQLADESQSLKAMLEGAAAMPLT